MAEAEEPKVDRPPNVEAEDFANYFSAYGYLYNQKEMLEDTERMRSYFSAIIGNRKAFAGKVVLDVGAGTGILGIWAAKAGAKKVYCVEATYMAAHAKTVADANGVGDIVEVIQATMEDVELPEKVDIIVSEWMGYMLLRESMLDSVLVARDRWLKPGGALYPSHATLYMAPMFDFTQDRRDQERGQAVANWKEFQADITDKYLVSFKCLEAAYTTECSDYFYKTALWMDVHPSQLLGSAAVMKTYDLLTVTIADLEADQAGGLTMKITKPLVEQPQLVNGILSWFTTDFRGSPANPAESPVTLTTAPTAEGATHWGQQCFHIVPSIPVATDDTLACQWQITRQARNKRLLNMQMDIKHESAVTGATVEVSQRFRVD